MTDTHILIVDDEPDILALVQEILEDEGFQVSAADSGEKAREQFNTRSPDLVLLDIWMPDIDGISLLKEWHEQGALQCPVVMMSGHGNVETAVEATRTGAFDFIEKPVSMGKLLMTVRKALEEGQKRQQETPVQSTVPVLEPMGNSVLMQALRQQAERAADSDASVIVIGDPGAGKENLARYIHSRSVRSEQPFVVADLAPLDETEQRSALLGDARQAGLLAQSRNGSLYISDIGCWAEASQQLLNAVMETGQIPAVDGQAGRPFAARVIAASRASLDRLVQSGSLDDSLYFRINVLPLEVPALNQRLEDIPDLVKFYAEYFSNRKGLPYRHFSVAAQNRLRNYHWPGNIRELRNLIKRLLILGQTDEISLAEVDQIIRQSNAGPAYKSTRQPEIFDLPLRDAREQFEREYLIYQLRKVGGSVGKLSEAVGMERTHLYRKLRSLGIDPKAVTRENAGL